MAQPQQQLLPLSSTQRPLLPSNNTLLLNQKTSALGKGTGGALGKGTGGALGKGTGGALVSLRPSRNTTTTNCLCLTNIRASSPNEIAPNALRRKSDPLWRPGFSLGVDLGMSRTGVALSKGFSARPLTVLEVRGQNLELRLLEIAEREEADEFIIGLPKSRDGKETPQSNVVRSFAGRFAVRAAERGWRVYLQNEHGTSAEAFDFMINTGLKKSARRGLNDAYAAMMVLERYFTMSGEGTEIVLPKQLELQDRIREGPPKDLDFFPEELEV